MNPQSSSVTVSPNAAGVSGCDEPDLSKSHNPSPFDGGGVGVRSLRVSGRTQTGAEAQLSHSSREKRSRERSEGPASMATPHGDTPAHLLTHLPGATQGWPFADDKGCFGKDRRARFPKWVTERGPG
jgi:hypothetical protein